MSDLLESAVAAHGGLARWNQVTAVTVDASIGGAFWQVKGKADVLKDVHFVVDTKRQALAMDYVGHDTRSVFEPPVSSSSAPRARSSMPATSQKGRSMGISSKHLGMTFISRTSSARRCGRI